MSNAMRYVAMAIAASHRLGWIALGLYIQRMNLPPVPNPFYDTLLKYHQSMGNDYHLVESCMQWADDYRMVMFSELTKRLEAIDDTWEPYYKKEQQKGLLIRKAKRARLELEDAWLK